MDTFKLGRLPRVFNPGVPHLSAMLAARPNLPPPPATVDYTRGMPANLGVMLNDTQGDCTCAAYYHARQVWTFNTGKMVTEPDRDVEDLYVKACGYDPRKGGEGPGGIEQDVLTYLLKKGAATGPTGTMRHKLAAFVEVDPRDPEDVKRTINGCGVAYIGFNVPANIMPANSPPPATWTVKPRQRIIGGHAVVLAGYDAKGARVISWGRYYTMTWDFLATYVDEAYALADTAWFNSKTKKSLAGLTLTQLEDLMRAL
ncbi:MAG TPA: hypothetical protein VGI57_00910 [Usitatibacter sp.]